MEEVFSYSKTKCKKKREVSWKKISPQVCIKKITEHASGGEGDLFPCVQCDKIFKSDHGLKIHAQKVHSIEAEHEILRKSLLCTSLLISSAMMDRSEHCQCVYCDEEEYSSKMKMKNQSIYRYSKHPSWICGHSKTKCSKIPQAFKNLVEYF